MLFAIVLANGGQPRLNGNTHNDELFHKSVLDEIEYLGLIGSAMMVEPQWERWNP